jgi:hypothetical protein
MRPWNASLFSEAPAFGSGTWLIPSSLVQLVNPAAPTDAQACLSGRWDVPFLAGVLRCRVVYGVARHGKGAPRA